MSSAIERAVSPKLQRPRGSHVALNRRGVE